SCPASKCEYASCSGSLFICFASPGSANPLYNPADFISQRSQMPIDVAAIRQYRKPKELPFAITKLGHIVLNCSDMDRSVRFYTGVLGFEISDVYPDEMVPGGMVFMRFNEDHHGVALVGSMTSASPNVELNHMAFEVASLDEVILARNHLKKHAVHIDFEGRRRAGVQIAVE